MPCLCVMLQFQPAQQTVIELKTGQHACLAPAGSGKTAILTERIVHALAHGRAAEEMLCLTFTNRAGLNMREQIAKRLEKVPEQLFIGNLHAYAFRQLSTQYRKKHMNLMDSRLQAQLLEQAMQQLDYVLSQSTHYIQDEWMACYRHYDLNLEPLVDLDPQRLQHAHSAIFKRKPYQAWQIEKIRQLILPLLSDARSLLKAPQKHYIRQQLRSLDQNITAQDLNYAFACSVYVHSQYQELKQYYQYYDYDDLILDTLLQQAHHPKRHYSWLQIDEVQDLSPLHWLLLDYLKAPNAHIVFFGDIHQSIYRFLGASIELTQTHLGEQVHYLQHNFRNPANLVELANAYSTANFDAKWVYPAQATKLADPHALLHLHRADDQQHFQALLELIQQARAQKYTSAILLPTNTQADEFARYLQQHQLEYFAVTQHDLLSCELFLDLLACLSSILDPQDQAAWARLLWRFGRIEQQKPRHLAHLNAPFAAIKLQHDLAAHGLTVADFQQVPDGYQHRLDYLVALYEQQKFLFVDTETTGLNPIEDDIVQIAAVNSNQELDLYCWTDQDLTPSQDIHHIDAELLARKGLDRSTQLHQFVQLSQSHVLVAHNLAFDAQMLIENLRRSVPQLVPQFVQQDKFCTLHLTQQLFPELNSYALADLLAYFELEGINSHNALDDVKAGVHLLEHLCGHIRQQQPRFQALYQRSQACLTEFNRLFSPLYQRLKHQIQADATFKVQDFIATYYQYIQTHLPELAQSYSTAELQQLQQKLTRHATLHFEQYAAAEYWPKLLNFYRTAKESDLITPDDYVIVSTMHRAKGLEFDQVILPSLTDRHFPSYPVLKKMQADQPVHRHEGQHLWQEQQRLLYVALTRAKQQLVIATYSHKIAEQKYAKPPVHRITPLLDEFQDYFVAI